MITVKLEGIKEALAQFDTKVVRRAAKASIERAVNSGKTLVADEVTKVWNVKKSDFANRIKITPPRMDDLKGVITISGKGLSLSYFGARQLMGNIMRTRAGKNLKLRKITRAMKAAGPVPVGVEVQILKGQRTTLRRSAFLAVVAAGRSGSHVGVFRRVGKKRLPIEEKKVVSVATMVSRPEVMESVAERIEERWAKEFPHQLEYYQGRADK